jgi:hypothetical protein
MATLASILIFQLGVPLLVASADNGAATFYVWRIALGLAAALPQWFVLRRHLRGHWWWLISRPIDAWVSGIAGGPFECRSAACHIRGRRLGAASHRSRRASARDRGAFKLL